MEILQIILLFMQAFLAFCNICIMLFAFKTFLSKPHDSLESRVAALEQKQKEHDQSLLHGNDRFRTQEKTNEVLIHSTLALIEFEIQYCLIEKKPMTNDLQKAKEDLNRYLATK